MNQINTIIFDLVGIFFIFDKLKILKTIGAYNLVRYVLKYGRSPFTESLFILDKMRQEVPGEQQELFSYKQYYLPKSLALWQKGLISSKEIINKIHQYLNQLEQQHYFSDKKDKELIIQLLNVMLDPKVGVAALVPLEKSIELLERLKDTKQYQLFLLSNIDHETFKALKKQYSDFFALFDGIVTSSKAQLLKPNKEIFEYLCNAYNLVPNACCFIDDQEDNIKTAEQLGMTTIYCTNINQLEKDLKKKGLL